MASKVLLAASDTSLMQSISKGNEVAFSILVKRHTHRYFQYAVQTLQSSADAEDAVQTAFIKLWQNPHSFDANKAKFTTWFYRVVLNACRDQLRRNRVSEDRIHAFVQDQLHTNTPSVAGEDALLEAKHTNSDQQLALEMAISQLNERDREVVNLVVYCELPQAEAAEIVGVSLKALESILSRAKIKLQSLVESIMKDSIVTHAHVTNVQQQKVS